MITATVFFDASALVKRYVFDPEQDTLERLHEILREEPTQDQA